VWGGGGLYVCGLCSIAIFNDIQGHFVFCTTLHRHQYSGVFPRTTWVSRHQKG